jgi:glycosyltransferase involved in cell wall biosynthesis
MAAAGRPAIFVGPERSEIARIIKEDNCGIVVPNGNSEGLVRVIGEIRGDPALGLSLGHRGRKALESKYSMRHACEAWHRLIHELADGRAGGPS